MSFQYLSLETSSENLGQEMYGLVSELYPICRSITGNGVRRTLEILKKYIPLEIQEVPTGTKVFDWVIPQEWNIRDAYVKDSEGNKVIDFRRSNLHVMNYSIPVHKKVTLQELKEHLYTIPEQPDLIPYRTSYYNNNWGFCLSHKDYRGLKENYYEVYIDSKLHNGHLTFSECFIKGQLSDEVLISTHICHPSLCNDNCSGIALLTFLARNLWNTSPKYSYRFLFIPGTIGSITWLSLNESNLSKIRHGLVAACVGDSGRFTYKRSRQGTATVDRAVQQVLEDSEFDYKVEDFSPYGYDERQYCSPGINLPIGCLMRTPHGRYVEYHTSADNLNFVQPKYLYDSFLVYTSLFYVLENNKTYLNKYPKCEPQLGSRGLYSAIGGGVEGKSKQLAILWVLNLSDGTNSLLDISERSNMRFDLIKKAADILIEHDLLIENKLKSDQL
jgi:aminopeptidase-like protein